MVKKYNKKWQARLLAEVYLVELIFQGVHFCTYEQFQGIGVVLLDLVQPFGKGILEGLRFIERKADQEYISPGIRQRTQPIILRITSRIPTIEPPAYHKDIFTILSPIRACVTLFSKTVSSSFSGN